MTCSAAIATSLLLLAAAAAAGEGPRVVPADVVVPFRARVESTSDWWALAGEGGARVIARFGDEAFGAAPAGGRTFRLRLEKGDIGAATATFLHADGRTAIAAARNEGKVKGDPRNPLPLELDLAPFERPAPQAPRARRAERPLALAFYYPWYGQPGGPSGRWLHWNPARRDFASARRPSLGYYDSLDPAVVREHLALAKEAGLDGFVASWWGPGTPEDRALALLLAEAAREGLAVAPYLEQARDGRDLVAGVRHLLARHGASPAALRLDGRPAIFLYARALGAATDAALAELRALDPRPFLVADALTPDAITRFDGVHTYIPLDIPPEAAGPLYRAVAARCAAAGKRFFATALPGYDDTAVRTPGARLERRGTEVLSRFLAAALGSGADGLLVTSWNEWHEGTEIEPSNELGGDALATLKEALAAWRER